VAKGEQDSRKSAGSKQIKKPSKLDKPGLPDEQLGKVAGGMASREDNKK
jgi:hypothetical protein